MKTSEQCSPDEFATGLEPTEPERATPWHWISDVRDETDPRPLKRPLSRRQSVEWLVQSGIESFMSPPTALLLLRVLSYVTYIKEERRAIAWIGRRKLAELSGSHRKTIDQQAVRLTKEWRLPDGTEMLPLFRPELVGRGARRRAVWVPIEEGWVMFAFKIALANARRRTPRPNKRKPTRENRGGKGPRHPRKRVS